MDLHEKYKNKASWILSRMIKSPASRELMYSYCDILELKKKDLYIRKGAPWNKFGLLISGSVFSYYFNEKGEQVITGFYFPPDHYIIVDYESSVFEKNISECYECFDDAVVLSFDTKEVYKLFDKIPDLHKVRLALAENRYFCSLSTIKLLKTSNANKKVKELFKQAPELFAMFPHSFIASYLGLHRNTYRKALVSLNKK
jgi:CRP-like cAMP-binding protein